MFRVNMLVTIRRFRLMGGRTYRPLLARCPVALLVFFWLLCLLRPALAQAGRAEQQSTFKVNVRTIEVPVTVLAGGNRVVTDLRRDDFTLKENGTPQNIRSLSLDEKKVHVVLLLDLSRSVKSQISSIKRAAGRFVDFLGPKDPVAVITFSQKVELVQDWTTDRYKLRRSINRSEPGTYTQLYDAVDLAIDQYLADIQGKTAIVLMTDGVDAVSNTSFTSLRDNIIQRQSSIYTISLLKWVKADMARYKRVAFIARTMERLGEKDYLERFFKSKEEEMRIISEDTGGRLILLSDIKQLERTYEQVARELKSQFLLTYITNQPDSPENYRKISITYVDPSCNLLYRRGYFIQ